MQQIATGDVQMLWGGDSTEQKLARYYIIEVRYREAFVLCSVPQYLRIYSCLN